MRSSKGSKAITTVFGRMNYILLLTGLAVIVLGYVIMRMDNQVDGFISLYVAPLLLLGGYLEIIYAILYKPRTDSESGS